MLSNEYTLSILIRSFVYGRCISFLQVKNVRQHGILVCTSSTSDNDNRWLFSMLIGVPDNYDAIEETLNIKIHKKD